MSHPPRIFNAEGRFQSTPRLGFKADANATPAIPFAVDIHLAREGETANLLRST